MLTFCCTLQKKTFIPFDPLKLWLGGTVKMHYFGVIAWEVKTEMSSGSSISFSSISTCIYLLGGCSHVVYSTILSE